MTRSRDLSNQGWIEHSNPNLIINGDMSVWQRGTSFTDVTTSNFYTADRWGANRVGGVSGGKIERSSSRLYISDLGSMYYTLMNRVVGTSGTESIGFYYTLTNDDSAHLIGQEVTLSFYVRLANNATCTSIRGFVQKGEGADERIYNFTNAAVVADTGFISISNQWTRLTCTGTVSGSATQIGIALQTGDFSGTAPPDDSVYITGVKLERGSVATPFVPDDPATNLAKCQRYYWVMDTYAAYYATQGTSTQKFCSISYPVTMRANPTVNAVYVNGNFIQNTVGKTQWNGYINSGTEDTVTHFIDNATFDAEL